MIKFYGANWRQVRLEHARLERRDLGHDCILNRQGIVREAFCEEVALRKPKEHEGRHVGSWGQRPASRELPMQENARPE